MVEASSYESPALQNAKCKLKTAKWFRPEQFDFYILQFSF